MSSNSIELTCIRCPRGCQISVVLDGSDIVSVAGQSCKREKSTLARKSQIPFAPSPQRFPL